MDPLVVAAGTAVVKAMATDSYESARGAVLRLWRRIRPQDAPAIEGELDAVREEVLAAREIGDELQEGTLAADWQRKLRRLLEADHTLRDELQRVLDTELTPLLHPEDQVLVQRQVQHVTASAPGAIAQGVLGSGSINNYALLDPRIRAEQESVVSEETKTERKPDSRR